MWRHRHGAVLAAVVALMVGAWVAQSAPRPLLWVAAAVAVAALSWWAVGRVRRTRERRALARTDLSELDLMSGTEFEEYVAGLMRVHGYTAVIVVGGADDGGADITARSPGGSEVVVQCKRWRHPVPPNDVRAFIGILNSSFEGYQGIFVASNGFTEAAAREGAEHMVLVDRDGLARWMGGVEVPEPPRA
ncbi:restriction endonuclease [Nocardiopsis sp. NPDC006198]|uniref:restriction endonuclease n=1 Tax=Nocardiopsis sp. NPDC006198 TaxID=3154472 RepID=UPI0033B2BD53